MSDIKCEVCGANIDYDEDDIVAACENCGAVQTVFVESDDPKKGDADSRADFGQIYDDARMAEHSDVNKALELYERLPRDYQDVQERTLRCSLEITKREVADLQEKLPDAIKTLRAGRVRNIILTLIFIDLLIVVCLLADEMSPVLLVGSILGLVCMCSAVCLSFLNLKRNDTVRDAINVRYESSQHMRKKKRLEKQICR